MTLRNRKSTILVFATISLNISASETNHIVKEGETISSILYELNLKPIYGKHGTLRQTLLLNPKFNKRIDNKIFPKEKLKLAIINEKEVIASKEQNGVLPEVQVSKADVQPIANLKSAIANDRTPSDEFKQGFYWKINPTLSWKDLNSTDENAFRQSNIQAVSDTSYGAGLTYGMHIEENLDIYSKAFFEYVTFQSDNSINLTQQKFLSTSFFFGTQFQQQYSLELVMNDQYFLTSSLANTIEIKKVTLPQINASYLKRMYQSRRASVEAIVSGRVLLPRSSTALQTKLGYGTGLEFQVKLMNQSFDIGYDYNVLKSTTNTTNSQNIYWKYIWETI